MVNKIETTPAKLDSLRKNYAGKIGDILLGPKRSGSPIPLKMRQLGEQLRNNYLKYPILPAAVHTYQDLASTREWVVSGKPRAAIAANEWLNNAETVNPTTGMVDYGFDQFARRRVLDYLAMGVTTFHVKMNDPDAPLEYLDPADLLYIRQTLTDQNGRVRKAEKTEIAWQYARQWQYRVGEVFYHYPIPVGNRGYVSPLMHLLPTATLSWLIRESDTASVDGRRIRDIIFVDNPQLSDTVEEALLMQIALWTGGNPEDIGIPIVTLQGSGNKSVKDMFARLGLSEVPETLDREKFEFSYVNEIAGALGLALRHFWNNERTTNRALEVVQEQRQQQKGPAAFVRAEQRLINRSGILKRFGGSASLPTRFSFIEESDASSMKDRAEVLKLTAEAFGAIYDRLQTTITPESFIAWMQSIGQIPYEVEFTTGTQDMAGKVVSSDATETGNPDSQQAVSDPNPSAMELPKIKSADPYDALDYGEIAVRSDGQIIAKRLATFNSVGRILKNELKDLAEQIESIEEMPEEEFLDDLFDESIELARKTFLDLELYDRFEDLGIDVNYQDKFDSLSYKLLNGVNELDSVEAELLQTLVLEL